MATSNLLKVGPTSIQLFLFNAGETACHVVSVKLAFSSNLNEQHTGVEHDRAVSVDFSWELLSYIWLTLATYQ